MRILIVGMHYAPEESGNAPYTTGFAEHLAMRGHDVHVLAGVPHYPSWKPGEAKSGSFNGVQVHRRWHFVPGNQSAPKRALYEGTFLLTGASLLGLPRPDAVLAIVPALSDGVLARVASRRFGVPYGVVFQDLMGLAASESGVSGGQRVHKFVKGTEGWIARGAQTVGVIAEGFRPYLESVGVESARVQRLRNWNQIPASTVDRASTRARMGWSDDTFVCLHAGNMGHKQGLESILETARLARDVLPALRFVLAGDGNRRRDLEELAVRDGLGNVQFLPTLGGQEYGDVLSAADVLLLNQRPDMKAMAFPSKITSYVFSGTPIVAAVDSDCDAARELLPYGAALVVEPGRPASLLAVIGRLRDDEELGRSLTLAARAYGQRHLTADAALSQWEAFALDLAGEDVGEDVLVREAA
jgi:colanic acid biosynthesis glycosyl transferase WcaI